MSPLLKFLLLSALAGTCLSMPIQRSDDSDPITDLPAPGPTELATDAPPVYYLCIHKFGHAMTCKANACPPPFSVFGDEVYSSLADCETLLPTKPTKPTTESVTELPAPAPTEAAEEEAGNEKPSQTYFLCIHKYGHALMCHANVCPPPISVLGDEVYATRAECQALLPTKPPKPTTEGAVELPTEGTPEVNEEKPSRTYYLCVHKYGQALMCHADGCPPPFSVLGDEVYASLADCQALLPTKPTKPTTEGPVELPTEAPEEVPTPAH